MNPKRVVVVGAGIAGLAAATRARQRGAEVVVLERAPEVGGKARTFRDGPWLVEEGPTSFVDNEPALDELVAAAGLEKLRASSAAARRYVFARGKLRELRPHPWWLATSGILSVLGFARLACEPLIPRKRDGDELESVAAFARRRLGREAAERLIGPMVQGIYAGDPELLGLRAAFPRMDALEREHGSLVRALIRLKLAGKLRGGPAGPGGSLASFVDGMQALPRALASARGLDVRLGVDVHGIEYDGVRWRVRVDDESLAADAVVLATPVRASAHLLRELLPDAARALSTWTSPPLAVVSLGYRADTARVPKGFGCLIARGEGVRALGVLWDSQIFPQRAPDGHLLLRAMIGGAIDPAACQLDDEALVAAARRDLERLHALRSAPVFVHVARWTASIPQYDVGHDARAARVRDALVRFAVQRPGLELAGNFLDGVAFGKAARSGLAAGERASLSSAALRSDVGARTA